MIDEKERQDIVEEAVSKAVEKTLLMIPEVIGNLMSSHASLHKINTEFYNNVNLINAALSDENGFGSLVEYPPNMGSLVLVGGNDVIIKKLDEYDIRNITLVKIDVEFSEVNVLMGSLQTLSESKPVLFIECGMIDNLKSLTDVLKPLGYKIKNVHANRIIEYTIF